VKLLIVLSVGGLLLLLFSAGGLFLVTARCRKGGRLRGVTPIEESGCVFGLVLGLALAVFILIARGCK